MTRTTAVPVRSRTDGRRAGLAVAAVAVGTLLVLLRQPGAGALDTVWAEDGSIFLSQADQSGPFAAFATSYAGYFHLVPRLLAVLPAIAPAGAAAALLAIEAALCTALVALLVYVASAGHIPSVSGRVLVSAAVVLIPVGLGDVLNSIANLHWFGLYALFWMLIWTPRGTAGRVVAAAVVLSVAGSDILVVVFVPWALVRLLRRNASGRRDRHAILLGVMLGLGLAVQLAGLLFGSSSRTLEPNPVRAVIGYVIRSVPSGLVGERFLGETRDVRWLLAVAVAWLVVLAAVAVAAMRITRPSWRLAALAGAHSVALYVLPVLLSGVATPRYAVAPSLLLLVALVALLNPGEGAYGRAGLTGLALLLAVVWVVNLRPGNERALGPRWSDELARARQSCVDPRASVDVPIAPREPDRWTSLLHCRYLTG